MFVVLGLIILIAAVVIGVAGIFNNLGSGHALTHGFSVFGYHVTGSTGVLFLNGIIVGAAAVLGLGLLLAAARRTSRRGRAREGRAPAWRRGCVAPAIRSPENRRRLPGCLAAERLAHEGVAPEDVVMQRTVDMMYQGQWR